MGTNGAVIAPYRTGIGTDLNNLFDPGGNIDAIDPFTGSVTTISSSGGFYPSSSHFTWHWEE